ncbi:MAG TPA: hypothetical protein VFG93_09660 [Gaiellaceae bacterium]|nr:hypothetical protein [Gaiellaceae bacterium]
MSSSRAATALGSVDAEASWATGPLQTLALRALRIWSLVIFPRATTIGTAAASLVTPRARMTRR